MLLLSRKGMLAVVAVTDIALNSAKGKPISGKSLASRHGLPPRYLEPMLQALVRGGILRSVRGPCGGYELAREQTQISANDILLFASTVEGLDNSTGSPLISEIVAPALAEAYSLALKRISVAQLVHAAEGKSKAAE